MSNRPSLQRKVTPKSKAEIEEALNEGVRIVIGADSFDLRVGDVTPRLARQLRAETGYSVNRLRELLASDPDIDLIQTVVWLARRIKGEQIEIDDVAIDYPMILGDDFDIVLPGAPDEVDASPEA